MSGQVIVGSVGNTPQFSPAKREQEFDIRGRLAVEAQFLRLMIAHAHLFFLHAQRFQPVDAKRSPVGEPLQIGIRFTEEFQFHLFKFAGTEGEVSRRDLVSERLTDLSDTERDLLSGSSLHIFEIYKDTLSRLRSQVNGIFRILGNALERLEHQVELTYVGKVMLSARRTGNIMILYKIFHLFLRERIDRFLQSDIFLCTVIFDHLIGAETLMAFLTVHQGIRKTAKMTGSHPGLGVHQNGAVHTYVVGILRDKFLPPGFLHIIF